MAVYLPPAKIAVEIVDDPTSLPVDLDAFPGFTVVPVCSADLRNPVARDRMVKRIARAARTARETREHEDGDAGAPTKLERKRLLGLIDIGLDLSCGVPSKRPAV